MQASTIVTKLNSILELIKFSKLRFAFMGLTYRDMELVTLKLKQLNENLKSYRLKRLTYKLFYKTTKLLGRYC